MKEFFLFVLITTSCHLIHGQDMILKMNNESIEAIVLEVSSVEIKYKKFENQGGPTYTLPISEIQSIVYQNGSVDMFNQIEEDYVISEPGINTSSDNMFLKGQKDADLNYNKYRGAGTGTLITSLLSPLLGLIPAIASSSTQPKKHNLGITDHNLMINKDYMMGYQSQAKKIKQRKVWTNWGIGLAANVVYFMIITSQ